MQLEINDASYVLNDPVCGKPFVYQRTRGGFLFYSLGANGVDDGGINNPREKKDDILLWPRNQIEIETDEEKVDMMI